MNISGTRKALNLIRSVLDTTKTTVSPIEYDERKPIFEAKDEMFFEGASPEECGIHSNYVFDFITELRKNKNVGLQSIMLMKGDKVFFDADVGMQDSRYPKTTFSECKSIVSLAVGVLVTQGKLRLSERVADILSVKTPAISKILLNGLTVRHLLTMTSGVTFNESEAIVTKNWVKAFMNSDTDGEFGEKFMYNSLNTYILSAIIKERTGSGLSEYLDETLFKELEISDYYWEKCPMGIEKGGWGLYLRREDMAKLGLLVMEKGVWKGKKLISPKYIEDATRTQVETPEEFGDFNYGFQIWCGRNKNSFLFNGMLGQNLLGYKDSGIMIIANCCNCDMFQQNDFFEICDRYFGIEFPDSLPENEKDYDKLCEFKEVFKKKAKPNSFLVSGEDKRDLEADLGAIDGKVFKIDCPNGASTGFSPLFLQLIQSNYTKGLKGIEFRRADDCLEIAFIEEDENYFIKVGFGKAETDVIVIHGEPFAVSVIGRFTENEDGVPVLAVDCDFLETPYTRSYKFFFDSDNYHAVFCESPGIELARNLKTLVGLLGENGQKLENLFSKFDGDYLSVKFEKAFSPRILLVEKPGE